jgi:hypothetical protein
MLFTLLFVAAASHPVSAPARPISLHPANPHYFLFRGKPTVLITSGEHYGAVLNRDFDYVRYLDTLKADGLNLTRTFSGVYREIPGNFNIRENTLAPKHERYVCPWKRTSTPGALDGLGKFDLKTWDEDYFKRLKDFVRQAGRRGVVVEMVLFCPFYEDAMWTASPMNAANNVNGIGGFARTEAYNLKHPELLAAQDAVVRKIAAELKDFDNLYYEICNEPYFGGVTLDWQRHISGVIVEAEANMSHKHLIAQNIANGSAKIENPDPNVSIFYFHYAAPPVAVAQNYHLNKPIAFDESGFAGNADRTYRAEAWHFMLAGGAVFDNLDYSFTAARPDGTMPVAPPTPGGGSPNLRKQLRTLREFLQSFNFIRMKPDDSLITFDEDPPRARGHALSDPGRAHAVYIDGRPGFALNLRKGRYLMEIVDPVSGELVTSEEIECTGVQVRIPLPASGDDFAIRITSRG